MVIKESEVLLRETWEEYVEIQAKYEAVKKRYNKQRAAMKFLKTPPRANEGA